MAKVKCKRAIRRIQNGSDILIAIAIGVKPGRVNPIVIQKEKIRPARIRTKSRTISVTELNRIFRACTTAEQVTKPAFAVHQVEAQTRAITAIRQVRKAKLRNATYETAA